MAIWVSTANVKKAAARLRAELEAHTASARENWWANQTSVEDVRAVLDEVERLRGQVESWRKRAERRTDRILRLEGELAELRECGNILPGEFGGPDNRCTKSGPHDWHQQGDGVRWQKET